MRKVSMLTIQLSYEECYQLLHKQQAICWPSLGEAEVYRTLQASLELQESYVFSEAITPWKKEVISDPSSPKPNPYPFDYTPEGKSD
ncbi:AMP deaminase, partial [Sarracenia purpurea var. burkii]